MAHYDGENNTKVGHNNNCTIWEDLSGNHNDLNFEGTTTTWENNYYNFVNSSTNYFESTKIFNFGTSDRTIEFVISNENLNLQNIFGIGKCEGKRMFDAVLYNNGYNCHVYGNSAKDSIMSIVPNKIYSNTWRYSDGKMKYRTNETNQLIESTVFSNLDTYPSKLLVGIGKYSAHNNNNTFKIYEIRIYNRILTDEEVQTNYEIDKYRFGIE